MFTVGYYTAKKPIGIYRFKYPDGTPDYCRMWDGVNWLYGRAPETTPLELAQGRPQDPVGYNRIRTWVKTGFTFTLVADINGNPLSVDPPSPIQLELF